MQSDQCHLFGARGVVVQMIDLGVLLLFIFGSLTSQSLSREAEESAQGFLPRLREAGHREYLHAQYQHRFLGDPSAGD